MLNRRNIFRKLFNIMTVASLLTGSTLLASPVLADSIITVTTTGDNTNSDGFCSLREAIANANDDAQTFTDCPAGSGNDTISFDNALGTATVTLTSASPFITDTDGLAIDGGSDIRVSGDNLYQVLYVFPSASLTLQNLTLINGKSSTGGGIFNDGSLTITNTTFTNNMATIHGGGIFNNGTLTVTNSLFLNNSATGAAGGIVNNGSGTIIVKNSTFIGNTAASAGAISQNDSGTLSITNSTFADNTAVNYGGSIYSTGETIVTNSTFSSNGAGISGSDIVFSTSASPTLSLYNNILANNDTSIGSCAVISGNVLGNNNLIEDATSTCGFTNGVDGNIIGSDPALSSLTGSPGYFPLNTGSLAINAGDNAICSAPPVNNESQNGVTRPSGTNCDIGAYEASAAPTSATFGDVPMSHPYWLDIEILYANGLTAGCSASPLLFCPDTTMDRAQSSVFMLRGNLGVGYVPPNPPFGSTFGDNWGPGPWAQKWAQGMLQEGLTAGCSSAPLLYCPWDAMPRLQAAVFGMRLQEGNAYIPPAATGTVFADITDPNLWYAKWAEAAYANGLLPACGSSGGKPIFCPNDLVSRGLGAYMIVRAKNLSMP